MSFAQDTKLKVIFSITVIVRYLKFKNTFSCESLIYKRHTLCLNYNIELQHRSPSDVDSINRASVLRDGAAFRPASAPHPLLLDNHMYPPFGHPSETPTHPHTAPHTPTELERELERSRSEERERNCDTKEGVAEGECERNDFLRCVMTRSIRPRAMFQFRSRWIKFAKERRYGVMFSHDVICFDEMFLFFIEVR